MVEKKELFDLYKKAGLLTRRYLKVKLKICPLLRIETFFPQQGRIIDLGCGNGLFALILKLGSAPREIIGFDLDEKKIKLAKELSRNVPACELHIGNIVEMDYPRADVFSLIDVLYLIPDDKQEVILKKCYDSLPRGGYLLIKEMDARPRWKYIWNKLQETLAVKVTGFTLGEKFYFRSESRWAEMLTGLGFSVKVERLDKGYWYPHILLICQK